MELTNIGTACVDNFVLAFTNSTAKVTTGINTMIMATLTAITNKNAEFLKMKKQREAKQGLNIQTKGKFGHLRKREELNR